MLYIILNAVGLLAGLAWFNLRLRREKLKTLIYLNGFIAAGGAFGALLFALLNMHHFNVFRSLLPWYTRLASGGFSYFFCMVFVAASFWLFCKLFKLEKREYFDNLAVCLIIILIIGKSACYINGCCGGIAIGDRHFPLQLLEIFAGCVALIIFYNFKKLNYLFWWVLSFSIFRLFSDFLSATHGHRALILHLTLLQLLAVAVVATMITVAIIQRKTNDSTVILSVSEESKNTTE